MDKKTFQFIAGYTVYIYALEILRARFLLSHMPYILVYSTLLQDLLVNPFAIGHRLNVECRSYLSDVTLILSSLEEWNRSSFSLKYSSMHCSSKSWTFFSSSSVMKSSADERV